MFTVGQVLEFPVKQRHIDEGEACKCESCPVALATLDGLRDMGVRLVEVGSAATRIYFKSQYLRCINYREVHEFVAMFDGDQSMPFEPFTAKMEVVAVKSGSKKPATA